MDRQATDLDDSEAIRNLLVTFPETAIIVILPPCRDSHRARQALQATLATLATSAPQATPPPAPEQGTPPASPHGGLANWQVRRLNAYIDDHLGETIHVRDLAAITRLSLGHFAHAFKQAFGEPPLAHITCRRLERACDRMLAGDEPLSRIAQECGFCDQSHFTRHFHRAMGMALQRWRRLHAPGPR
ncbi:helix-turn-helix domain-containing protein [Halomonas salifodinae]|uniref:Helix-turn-helix domain-containing protein n=1 Tax=Halomonas salifodinae TaxID=438745 RepID=A0ABW2ETZ6_9GAMM